MGDCKPYLKVSARIATTPRAAYPALIENFAMVPRLAISDRRLSPIETRLYMYYVDFCGADRERTCFQGVEILAKELGSSKNSLSRARQSLESKGLIKVKLTKKPYPIARRVYDVTVNDIWDANAARFAKDLVFTSLPSPHANLTREEMSIQQLKKLWRLNQEFRATQQTRQ